MDKKELFSSLIADIKNYNGSDPLRPWIRGIRRMKESLRSHQLKENLPRFLQKCAQTFESDRRYRNDSRYLSVWIQLMDYVDDARVLLRKMEKNGIGLKRAMFYSAYALYYEKRKRFEDADAMYHLGVQNLAEPANELHKSYSQFLHRMKLVKKRKARKAMFSDGRTHTLPLQQGEDSKMPASVIDGDHHKDAECINLIEGCPKLLEQGCKSFDNSLDLKRSSPSNPSEAGYSCHPNLAKANPDSKAAKMFPEHERKNKMPLHKPTTLSGDDTVVVKFVGSAIVGKSEAEDACHHGLVDPTVNMKEAMNAISNMFREPLEVEPMGRRRSTQSKPKASQQSNMFEVYVDESSEEKVHVSHPKLANSNASKDNSELQKPFVGAFKIWTDDDDESDNDNGLEIIEHMEEDEPRHYDLSSSSSSECNATRYGDGRLKEDTVVRRFVGSTVLGEPEVENACHHGLVDPTINMKEAMDDINSMFGKPLNFVRASKQKKQTKQLEPKPVNHGFSILADDDLEEEDSRCQIPKSTNSKNFRESDLFEPTQFTKEAMADINEMFGKSLDF